LRPGSQASIILVRSIAKTSLATFNPISFANEIEILPLSPKNQIRKKSLTACAMACDVNFS
jgi:hypothetical protein